MLSKFLPPQLRAIICIILHFIIAVVLGVVIYLIAALKYVIPIKSWHIKCGHILNYIPVLWTDLNDLVMRLFTQLDIVLIGAENLQKKKWYLMTANHKSWSDVLILYRAFNHRIPVLKFFMKSQLLWIPVIGLGCWLIGYPFMKRYTKEQLAKKPELKGKDLITTRKLCERFKKENIPMTIISFAEGTRYTSEKAARQQTPFKNLLKPRAGGLAYTLMAMGDSLQEFLNVTIVYPTGRYKCWDYMCGRINKVIIKIETYPLTSQTIGDYDNSAEDRARFQSWLNDLWQKKDTEIEQVKKEYA